MYFDQYGGHNARLATDLANTAPDIGPDGLAEVFAEHGVMEPHRPTPAEAARIRDWARRLDACFGVAEVDELCVSVNRLLEESTCRPRLVRHRGHHSPAPHLHFNPDEDDLVGRIAARTAAALAHVIAMAGPERLGRCARPACGRAFLDTSRNGRRRYCTVRCANNEAVARHRARGGTSADAPMPVAR